MDDLVKKVREKFYYDERTGHFFSRKTDKRLGSRNSKGYRTIFFNGNSYREHRIAWLYVYGQWPKQVIDHINGIRDDNRIANLREATLNINSQNCRAAYSTNKLGILGVCVGPWKRNPYRAHITVNGKNKTIGSFRTPEEAHAAYLDAKRRLHEGCTL